MSESAQRGSAIVWERVFEDMAGEGEATPAAMAQAIDAARVSYQLKRWWWYGQPAIDALHAVIDVDIQNLGAVVSEIAAAQGRAINVASMEVFPYGIVNPDGAQINLVLQKSVR